MAPSISLPTNLPPLPIDFIHAGVRDTTAGTLYGNGWVVAFESFARSYNSATQQFEQKYVRKKIYTKPERTSANEWDESKVVLDSNGRAFAYGDGNYMLCLYKSTNPPPAPNDDLDPDPGIPDDIITPVHYGHEVVNVLDFGAVADCTVAFGSFPLTLTVTEGTDNTAAFQAAIDYCLSDGSRPRRLFIPAGRYFISDTLKIMKNFADPGATPTYGYVSLHIYGEKRAVGTSPSSGQTESIIFAGFADRPAIAIQAGNGVRIRDLSVHGVNQWNLKLPPASGVGDPLPRMNLLLDDKTFSYDLAQAVNPADPLNPKKYGTPLDQPQSPYVGIAIDAYSGDQPSFVKIPYAAQTMLYDGGAQGSLRSSAITFEGVEVMGFVVGVAITPTGFTGNAENITFIDVTFSFNKVALSIGQSQSRSVHLINVNCNGAMYFVDTRGYGKASDGTPPFIRGGDITTTRHLFHLNTLAQSFSVRDLYCESTLGIGYVGTDYTPSQLPVLFDGCTFSLHMTRPMVGPHLWNFSPVHFSDCSFEVIKAGMPDPELQNPRPPLMVFNNAPVTFTRCMLTTPNLVDEAGKIMGNLPMGFHDLSVVRFESMKIRDETDDAVVFSYVNADYHSTAEVIRRIVPPGARIGDDWSQSLNLRIVSSAVKKIALGTLVLNRLTADTASFIPPTSVAVRVGDLLSVADNSLMLPQPKRADGTSTPYPYKGPIGMITKINTGIGGTAILTHVFDALFGQSTTTSRLLEIAYLGRYHPATQGDLVASDPNVNLVAGLPLGTWKAGDRVWAPTGYLRPGTYITSVFIAFGGINQLTLNKAPLLTGRVRLFDADVALFSGTSE